LNGGQGSSLPGVNQHQILDSENISYLDKLISSNFTKNSKVG